MTIAGNPSTTTATTTAPAGSDVLHSENHSRLTTEDIAKAVARHKREHPNPVGTARPQKTTPRQ